jgi:signal transduction histidine kinase
VIEQRAIGWRLPVTLSAVVVLDQLIALGALGVVPRNAAPLGPRLIAGLLAVMVLCCVLLIARWTWLRSGLAQRHPSVGVLTVALAVQVGLSVSRGVLVDLEVLERQVGVAFDEFVFLTATTVVVLLLLGALRRHHDLMADIEWTTARLSAAQVASTTGVLEERARLARQVRDLLEQRLGPTSLRAELFTPERLQAVADDVLRPLSHQLEATPAEFTLAVPRGRHGRRARLTTVLRQLRPEPVVRPRLLAAAMGLLVFRFSITPPPLDVLDELERLAGERATSGAAGGGPDVVVTVDWSSLLESFGLHAATMLLVLLGARLLARWLAEREQPSLATGALVRAWAVTVTSLTALGLVSLTLLRIVFGMPGFTDLPPVTLGVTIGFLAPLLLITTVTSGLPAAEAALADTRTQLNRTNEQLANAIARANALHDHERRLFARHLHASVQAAVNAASLAIERATLDGKVDADVVARAGASIDAAVERLRDETSTSAHGEGDGAQDLTDRLGAIVATWEPLALIELDLGDAIRERLARDAVGRATLCDVIAEACANAVIHGRATRVSVHVRLDASDERGSLELRVDDDGSAVAPQHRDGLGSRILSTTCTAWHLEHHADGTTLTAKLPVR